MAKAPSLQLPPAGLGLMQRTRCPLGSRRSSVTASALAGGQGGAGVVGTLREAQVINPGDGSAGGALDGAGDDCVVVVLPQLGDFSTEYVEQLLLVEGDLAAAGLDLRVVAIGDTKGAEKFAGFVGLPLNKLRVCPDNALHMALGLYNGPNLNFPGPINNLLPEGVRGDAKAWLNYMAMCAGIASPGTVQEIARGYLGDRTAPERLADNVRVEAGPINVTGTQKWGIGPMEMDLWWANESGYQRPVELATVRLRSMVEALSNWDIYVPDASNLAQRGGTFVLQGGAVAYEWRDKGILTYSETMSRPLTFLEPFIGPKALNPLGLGDPRTADSF